MAHDTSTGMRWEDVTARSASHNPEWHYQLICYMLAPSGLIAGGVWQRRGHPWEYNVWHHESGDFCGTRPLPEELWDDQPAWQRYVETMYRLHNS